MKVWTLALAAALTGVAAVNSAPVEAKTASKAKKTALALTPVRICPMSGTPVKGDGAGSTVVGKYKVYFC